MKSRVGRIKSVVAALAAPCVYACFALYKVTYPGVHYDELLFLNPNTWKSWHGIRLLIMPYIGTLKTWLMEPTMNVFGVSVATIRVPAIAATALSLLLLWMIARRFFGRKIATLATLLLAVDPGVIAITRMDFGPVVIAFFLRVVMLGIIFRFIQKKRLAVLLWLVPLSAIGIFNKLDFLWFVNAVFICLFLLNARHLRVWFKSKKDVLILVCLSAGYLMAVAYYLWIFKESAMVSVDSISSSSSRLGVVFAGMLRLLSGESFYHATFVGELTAFALPTAILCVSIIAWGTWLAWQRPKTDLLRSVHIFLLLNSLLVLFQIGITSRANAPWHFLMLFPGVTLLIASGFVQIEKKLRDVGSRAGRLLIFGVLLFLFVHSLAIQISSVKRYTHPSSVFWTPVIYDLIEFASAQTEKFETLDWGAAVQLMVFDQTPRKYGELTFVFRSAKESQLQNITTKYLDPNKNIIFISRPISTAYFPESISNFFEFTEKAGLKAVKIKEFKDDDRVIFELYKVVQPTTATTE